MFPSPNNTNINPFELFLKRSPNSLFDHQSPISNQLDDPQFLFNFPTPFFDEHDELPLNQILSQSQIMAGNHSVSNDQDFKNISTDSTKVEAPNSIEKPADPPVSSNGVAKRRNLGAVALRKRTGKKDRHSKICTAQGIRDRRMRLSLQAARKFFDLQDMLGYDKASKTIEWLFANSNKAIKDLMMTKDHTQQQANHHDISDQAKTESFVSECEGVSGIEVNSNGSPNSRKTACVRPNRVESRDKARARARCRTREKMMNKLVHLCKSSPNDDDFQKLGSCSKDPFEKVDQESSSLMNQEIRLISPYIGVDHDYPSVLENQFADDHDDEGTIEKLLQGSSSNSSTSCPNNHYNNQYCSSAGSSSLMGILGNWDLLKNERLINSTHHHFALTDDQVSLGGNPNLIFSDLQLMFHQ